MGRKVLVTFPRAERPSIFVTFGEAQILLHLSRNRNVMTEKKFKKMRSGLGSEARRLSKMIRAR
jgi:hypothetical protein